MIGDFIHLAHTPEGGRRWAASIIRSLGVSPMQVTVHQGAPQIVQLWWGPVMEVRPGDKLAYFVSHAGIEIEAVERPTARMLGGMSTVRFS